MKLLLLFPPDWLPSEPYLSLPSLAAVLRPAGHKVLLKDINVEMYDLMFSASFLRHVQKRIGKALRQLRSTMETRSLNEEEQRLMNQLFSCNEEWFVSLIDKAKKAKDTLRSQDFYDINKLEWANNCLHQTMNTISLGYYPARICFPPVETDLVYKPFISGEILKAIDDCQINVYRDVYHFLIAPLLENERPEVVGISVVQRKQLIPTFTFCKMIKEAYPEIHISLGGNIITRIRDVLVKRPALFQLFDTAVLYEGESTLLELMNALDGEKKELSVLPNLIYKDTDGIHLNTKKRSEDLSKLPPPDFDGLPLDTYFVPKLILPYLATRGCYWGRCTFCDHFQGYAGGFRTKPVDQVIAEITFLKKKYGNQHFHFTDESYPPALFRRLSRKLIEKNLGIVWTTHLRFEELLMEEDIWRDAARSGCKYLHFGYESGNERVLKLMGKDINLETVKANLRMSAKHGIWNHCMGFFGFPGETREEAEDSKRFLQENREYVHSVGFTTFALGKFSPVAMDPERFGVSVYKNPEWDLAMDYYFTPREGLSVQEALEVFKEFEYHHDPKWDLRISVREYIFLYVDYYKTNTLTQLPMKPRIQPEHYHNPVGMV
ncbi:MAG: radical SAM protein [Candidatus Brocadiaceae bacterium]|nr:radical SAM protein [Candidatus Brocadiaceae bacterium]